MNLIIIGAGDFGFHLAKRLSLEKYDITLIDYDTERVKYVSDHLDIKVIEGHGTNYDLLKLAGIDECDAFAAVTNNDEVNLLACQMAKKAGVKMKIARVRNPDYTRDNFILSKEELGADFIIQPERETANAIVKLIKQTNATDIVEFEDGKMQVVGIRLDKDSTILHTPLMELGKTFGNPPMRILAIKRKQYTIIPKGEDLLLEGDQLYFISDKEFLPKALKLFGKSDTKIENCMIIGGGLVGKYTAKMIENEIQVKIIEKNEKKSHELAEKCSNTLIIHGDGSDLDLLTFEGLPDMDVLVAITGDDETNIITSLVARHLEIPRTITLVRKMDYVPLTGTVGLDAIVNKQLIAINAIQKYLRQREIAYFAELPGIDAEIVEFIASEKSKIIKKPLFKIDFPKDAIVGAVLKANGVLEIPKGNTQIESGDKVVVFTLPKDLKDVEKMF